MKLLFLTALTLMIRLVAAQDEAAKPVNQATALKSGLDQLVEQLGDQSEAGIDNAANLYATAKRIETESKLAAKDLTLVIALADIRSALIKWNSECSAAGYVLTGGGTMWSHGSIRAQATIEDILAKFASRLPLKSQDVVESKAWKSLKTKVSSLKLSKDMADADPEAGKNWAKQKELLGAALEELGWVINTMPTDDSAPLMTFITDCIDEVITASKEL
ncbi:MAG: hypothetical protein JNJ83_19810 [Verrucomicrobiaceae bacterium]|nr:hypothetical protein [Verrucomicrobiaceae bacterium]